jgi:hypothetical protein
LRDASRFNSIATALDTLGDTSAAIHAYAVSEVNGKAELYLLMYGVLQALYLQQDSAFWLCKFLDLTPAAGFKTPGAWTRTVPALDAARTARNNSLGHPVRRDKGGPLASFFLVQHSLDAEGFQLIEAEGNRRRFVSVNVKQLVEDHLSAVAQVLVDSVGQLGVHLRWLT